MKKQPEKKLVRNTQPGDIVHIRLPVGLKDKFKDKCWEKKTSMNGELLKFIKRFTK